MLCGNDVPYLTKEKTEPDDGDGIKGADAQAKPSEWGDGLQTVSEQ